MGCLWKLTLILGIWMYVTYQADAQGGEFVSPGDPGFFEFQEKFNFTLAWTDLSPPQSLSFTIKGERDAMLAISPVPDLTSHHYIVAINSLNGCGWPSNSHVLARNNYCTTVQEASDPIISEGKDVEFTLTVEDDGMKLTSGSSLSLSMNGYERICTCCYIGIYSSFGASITWTFPETDDLVPVINLVGKDSIQSIVTDGAAVSDRAIDGSDSTDVDDDTCAITTDPYASDGIGPYWRVDLGAERRVDQVVLFDAFDCPTCCPDASWVVYGKYCYKAFTAADNAAFEIQGTDALTACQAEDPDSDLASIHSYRELSFLRAFATSGSLWIGLRDSGTEGDFVWDDASSLDYTRWGRFRPDTTVANDNDCVYLTSNGRWVDVDCNGPRYGYICKTRQGPVLDGLEVYVGSCDHTGTIDYNGATPDIDDNNMCGTVNVDAGSFVAEELYGAVTVKCDPPLYGRYIYVYRPENLPDPDTLTLCEVQAFGHAVDCSDCCPVGWSSFQLSCYKVFPATNTFNNIESTCPSGSNLVAIHSQEELHFLAAFTADASPLWIGLDDKSSEGAFEWTDGSALDFRAWAPSLPNAVGGNTDDCVYLGTDGLWYDTDCASSLYGKICQQPRDLYTRISPLIRFPMQEQTVVESVIELPIEIALYFEGPLIYFPTCYRFDVTTVQHSAVTGSDFTEFSETFTHDTAFQPCDGGLMQCYSIEIPITDDLVSENLEYFTVNFFNVIGLDIGQLSFNPFRVNIQDDDGCFELARYSYTAVEPSSRPLIHKWVNITVIFRAAEGELPPDLTGSVMLSTLPIDATAAADYEVYTNHLVEFGEGVRSMNVPVGITDDRLAELNETFRVVISGPSDNYQLCGTSEAIVTILDNDHTCFISQSNFMALESQETLEVIVNCEELVAEGASIGLSAQGISAVDGTDYRLQDSWVVFDGTSLTATFIIDIIDDDILEDPETFRLQLINGDGVNIGNSNEALVSIADDDANFSLERSSFSASEGDASQVINLIVDRDGYLANYGSVWIRTRIGVTGNAKPADSSDFMALNQEVVFESGDVEQLVEIRLIDDSVSEELVESFLVELYNSTNGVIDDPDTAEVFIYDDDDDVSEANQIYYYLSNEEYEVMESENGLQVTVYRTDDEYPGSVILSTGYFSTPGDARASEDYVQLNQRLEFAAGDTSKTATIQIIGDDNVIEGPKKFHVDLSFPLGGKIRTPGSATITIIDNDITISFVDTQYAALEGDGTLSIPVRRKGYMGPISVDAILSPDSRGSAEEGVDFFAPDSTIFGQGESDALLHISIVDDAIDEATTESFTLELVDPANGQVVEPAKVSVVIFDNDEEEESDGNGNVLGSTAITFIGLGAGFGLLALIALVAGIFICMRVASANRLSRSRQYLAPAPRPYRGGAEPRPYLSTENTPPSYELRGRPYYLR